MKQMEAQKWKDACSQLEKQLKELQAALSPSPSRVRMSFLLNHKCIHYTYVCTALSFYCITCTNFYSDYSREKTACC